MKLMIDTNIILDVLCDREPFVEDSIIIFKMCEDKQVEGYISALSIPNIVYILRREMDHSSIKQLVDTLNLFFSIVDLKNEDLLKTVDTIYKDFEDAIQYTQAERIHVDIIITRNKKDFNNNDILALTPSEFVKYYVEKKLT